MTGSGAARARGMAQQAGERMSALADRLAAADAPEGPVTGSDRTGTAHVEIDAGGEVVAVRLDAAWRSEIGSGVGEAIVSARRAASMQSLERQAEALRGAVTGSARVVEPTPEQASPVAGARPGPEEILEILLDYRREETAMRAASDALRTQRREISDVEGWATATVQGGQVVAIDIDPGRLRHASDREVEKVALRLFAAAGSSLRAAQEQLDQDFPATARLMAASRTIALPGL